MGAGVQALPTPPASPEPLNMGCEGAMVDEYSYDAPLSPASTDSDGESTCSSDDESLASTCSTVDDLDEEDFAQNDLSPKEQPLMYDSEDASMYYEQDYSTQYPGSIVEPCQPCQPIPVHVPVNAPIPSGPKLLQFPPLFWDMMNRYVQPVSMHQPVAFHHAPMPLMHNFQGCY